ncbi:MAG TPA: YedE family putative selenium transporter [Anaerolineae bacterium]|nr:YedE family putative selenium transporter [Anaerolineae bacterium]HOQ97645.1 YedE family putative selenium transporter [Anaerolineae bacterium]HPL28680.1 YedE family putative selenium transporter [Anaerolineae bacterium]
MSARLNRFFASRWGIIAAGAAIGLLAALLQRLGNPPNMGICVACFERDIAGALGLHRAATVQYIRPEIIALVLGSMVAALLCGEFRPRGGSAPVVRFVLGAVAMVGSLAFLGCPWRALLRLAGGDLNAIFGLAGLAVGIAIGVWFLRAGYSLGRSTKTAAVAGWAMPALMIGLLLLAVLRPQFTKDGPIFLSSSGPGSLHAPLLISLAVGLAIGFVAQRTRFCTMGAIRDAILMRDTRLLSGVAALVVTAFVANLAFGQVKVGLAGQPIAHSSYLWNVLGMVLAGLAFALAGGCPGRQLFLSGEGDGDAAIFVLGMITGAAFAHNLGLAASPDKVVEGVVQVGGLSAAGMWAVALGLVVCLAIGFGMREKQWSVEA